MLFPGNVCFICLFKIIYCWNIRNHHRYINKSCPVSQIWWCVSITDLLSDESDNDDQPDEWKKSRTLPPGARDQMKNFANKRGTHCFL